jgi:Sec7-like guanine-nucleotide exchange factor
MNQSKLLESNPDWTLDCVEFLAMSILVLNTNIHSDKIPKSLKLTKAIFVKTNKSVLNELTSLVFLGDIYDRIAK